MLCHYLDIFHYRAVPQLTENQWKYPIETALLVNSRAVRLDNLQHSISVVYLGKTFWVSAFSFFSNKHLLLLALVKSSEKRSSYLNFHGWRIP